MNRRAFLGTLLGAGAAAVAAPLLPSEVWPFRKIFLPGRYLMGFAWDYGDGVTYAVNGTFEYPAFVNLEAMVEAIELEHFKRQIPDLLRTESEFYKMIKLGDYRPSQLTATAAIREMENRNRKRVDILANWPEQVPLRMANGNEIEMPRNLLHAKATPENIERWIDELVPKSKG